MTRWIVAGVLTAALAVAAGVYVLKVTAVEVVGASALSPNDILAASGLRGGERIFWLRTGRIASRIEAFASVSGVDVQRALRGTIVIRVAERSPTVTLGRGLAADANGIVFAYPPTPGVPELVGWRAQTRPGALLDNGSRAVLASFRQFPEDLRRRVRRISLVGSVTMLLTDGTEIRFGQPLDLVTKARAALAVLTSAAGRRERLAYVDVRAPSVPASRGRTPPSPSPTPTPVVG